MLISLPMGMALNPISFKYIKVVAKRKEGRVVHIVQLTLDDNSVHILAECTKRREALELVSECAKRLFDPT